MDDADPPSDIPVIFPCPKCSLLCQDWREAKERPRETTCRHCGAIIAVPKRSSVPPQYEVENVDFRYDLSHVLHRISKGWKSVRDLACALGLSVFHLHSEFADPTHRLDERIVDGIHDVVICAGPGWGLLVPCLTDMAFEMTLPRGKCKHGKKGPARRQYWTELTPEQQLQASRLLAQALSQPGNMLECLMHVWPPQTVRDAIAELGVMKKSAFAGWRLPDNDRQKMSWICQGAESHDACDEAWWKCVTLETQVAAEELRAIQDKVNREEPLSETDQHCLNEYLTNASPFLIWRYGDDGGGEYLVKVTPDFDMINRFPMRQMAIAFLVQPAYAIARKIEEWCTHVGRRWIVTCRNPQCGHTFYSGHPDAVACPKPAHKRGTSPCKREWDRYKRWLQKTRRNPDTEWSSTELRQEYLAR